MKKRHYILAAFFGLLMAANAIKSYADEGQCSLYDIKEARKECKAYEGDEKKHAKCMEEALKLTPCADKKGKK